MGEGLELYREAALRSPASKRSAALREVILAEQLQRMMLSNHAILEFEDFRLQLAAERNSKKAAAILDRMETILREEIARTELSLLAADRDSRLGFQFECDYVYSPYSLQEKLASLRETLEKQLTDRRKRTSDGFWVKVTENDDFVKIETDKVEAVIPKKNPKCWMTGIEKQSFLDKTTGSAKLATGCVSPTGSWNLAAMNLGEINLKRPINICSITATTANAPNTCLRGRNLAMAQSPCDLKPSEARILLRSRRFTVISMSLPAANWDRL